MQVAVDELSKIILFNSLTCRFGIRLSHHQIFDICVHCQDGTPQSFYCILNMFLVSSGICLFRLYMFKDKTM